MKKIICFLLLTAATVFASNEGKVLHIFGPSYISEHSYNVRYYMAVSGNLNGNPIDHHWECTDLNGNPLNYIQTSVWNYDVFLDIGDQPFILNARLRYTEHVTHEEKYIYASYVVNVGEPLFTLTKVSTIRDGEWDQYGKKHIYFNLDGDGMATDSNIEVQDFLVGDKTYLDDELLPLTISHTPSTMNVDYVLLRAIMPNHIRLCRSHLEYGIRHYKSIAVQGQTTDIYCGANFNKGNIFDCNLYLESVAIGSGHVRLGIGHKNDTNYFDCIADINYGSCADIHGRQPNRNERSSLKSSFQALIDCEYSVVDDWTDEYMMYQNNNYNAPAYAVDPSWSVIGFPFKVFESGYGTTANPIVYSNGLYCTSYEAFEGASEFYRSTIWPINLYSSHFIGDSIVLFYGGLLAARRSDSGNGNIGNMFIMKLENSFFLNHNGKDFFDYYTEHPINSYTPVKYAPILEEE